MPMHLERAMGRMLTNACNFCPHQDRELSTIQKVSSCLFAMSLPLPPAALLPVTSDVFDLFWNFLSRESVGVGCVSSWLLSLTIESCRFSDVVACIVLPFSSPSNMPLPGSVVVCLSTHLWMGIWVATGNIQLQVFV